MDFLGQWILRFFELLAELLEHLLVLLAVVIALAFVGWLIWATGGGLWVFGKSAWRLSRGETIPMLEGKNKGMWLFYVSIWGGGITLFWYILLSRSC